jgi:hypothetical protein
LTAHGEKGMTGVIEATLEGLGVGLFTANWVT